MASPRIAVRLPDELYERLITAAEADHRTVSNMVVMLLDRHLPKPEAQQALDLGLEAQAS